jgi:hypothetical protein
MVFVKCLSGLGVDGAAERLGAELRRTDRSAKRSTHSNFQNAHDLGAAGGVSSSAVLGGSSVQGF